MKIIAITKSQERPKEFVNKGLKYITRAGYAYKIYLKEKEREQYDASLFFAKSDHYLYYEPESIIYIAKASNIYQETLDKKIKQEAKEEGFNLLLYIPDNLARLPGIKTFDESLLYFCRYIGEMRKRFSEDKTLLVLSEPRISRDLYMQRLI